MFKFHRHCCSTGRKVLFESLHQGSESYVSMRLISHDEENRTGHVAHSLAVAYRRVIDSVPETQNQAQITVLLIYISIILRCENVEEVFYVGIVIPSTVKRIMAIGP